MALKSLLQPVPQQRKQAVSGAQGSQSWILLLERFPEGNHKSDAAALSRFGGWVERWERERDSRPIYHHLPSPLPGGRYRLSFLGVQPTFGFYATPVSQSWRGSTETLAFCGLSHIPEAPQISAQNGRRFYTQYLHAWCVCVCVCALSRFRCQGSLSMRFSRQEYWIGLPCPSAVDLSDPGIEPAFLISPALAGEFFTTSLPWEFSPLFFFLNFKECYYLI